MFYFVDIRPPDDAVLLIEDFTVRLLLPTDAPDDARRVAASNIHRLFYFVDIRPPDDAEASRFFRTQSLIVILAADELSSSR